MPTPIKNPTAYLTQREQMKAALDKLEELADDVGDELRKIQGVIGDIPPTDRGDNKGDGSINERRYQLLRGVLHVGTSFVRTAEGAADDF